MAKRKKIHHDKTFKQNPNSVCEDCGGDGKKSVMCSNCHGTGEGCRCQVGEVMCETCNGSGQRDVNDCIFIGEDGETCASDGSGYRCEEVKNCKFRTI
jgi:hypothetical protein